MKVLFFAAVAEITGIHETEFSGAATVEELKSQIEKQYPLIKPLNCAIAVNNKIATAGQPVNEEDEVAFLPPFSGG